MPATDKQDSFESDETTDGLRSSRPVLAALKKAEREFNEWNALCHEIDEVYSLSNGPSAGEYWFGDASWRDSKLDLFWASFEVLKPAVYARAPVPAVAPVFKDNNPLKKKTAELLERASTTALSRNSIDDVMCLVRDDLLFAGRGVLWLRYDTDDGQQVCIEHLDRQDFLHEPCRYWGEVGWVARRAWMTRTEVEARFGKEMAGRVKFTSRRSKENDDSNPAVTPKAGVWEVWHRADGKVYWVSEGCDVCLDEGEPQLKLRDFFPCPRPAFGTLKRRSLIPTPDWERYAVHFRKISELTARIYLLLDSVRMKGLIPAGGEVGDAVEMLLASDDDQMLVPVSGVNLTTSGGSFVQWMPLAEIAQAITGLIDARTQLISDFYELSGISDIMRGATEASETLGAQQLKSQYGSVRVRQKVDELQRIAADSVRIACEVVAEKFTKENLLDMAQMEVPGKKDIEKRIREIEKAAEEEMKALAAKFEEAAKEAQTGAEQDDPEAARQAMQAMQQDYAQQQQAIYDKFSPMLAQAEAEVPLEDIIKLLRDDRARSFAFEIESDSTILTDELQEKQSRQEFMEAFTASSAALMQLAGTGEQGAHLAGELMKFTLAPYRIGRQLDDAVNAFVDAAPQIAAQMAGDGDAEGQAALVEANNKLAEAEMQKAQASIAKVQADAQKAQQDAQLKAFELEQKQQLAVAETQQDQQRFQLELEQTRGQLAETQARIEKIYAEIEKLGVDASNQTRKEDREDVKAVADIRGSQEDRAERARQASVQEMQQEHSATWRGGADQSKGNE